MWTEGPKFDARAVQECGNDPTALLRDSGLTELLSDISALFVYQGYRRTLQLALQKHAIASLPGHGLNYLERCGGMDKLPVCVAGGAGVDLDETVKSCKQHGLRPERLCSAAGWKFWDASNEKTPFVPAQSVTLSEQGKTVPYLRPRTWLSEEGRTKLGIKAGARRSTAALEGPRQAEKVDLITDAAAAESKAETAKAGILKQIDFIVTESFGPVDPLDLSAALAPNASLRSSLQVLSLLPSGEPPELSLLHEELASSIACVVQEFPGGVVPPDRRATPSQSTGTIRAKAVRIRGVPESAYPFIKGGATALADANQGSLRNDRQMEDLSGVEE
ncbi:unnamed protein product [Effrenium voratum]|uniref:Uncharacterized protein n=1 Tax=Effrenium voratum TaxID=2562239 RepID=A0AA36HVT2_9DINO|nr:unnamed protein product [Effrenium voratum]